MQELLVYVLVGLTTGAIYAIAATGLVVTYTTSRVFNFAHGALGMFLAFVYYQLRVPWGMPSMAALAVTLLVIAPILGILLDVLVMRRIQGRPAAIRIVVTLALFIVLEGLATIIWGTSYRAMPAIFGQGEIRLTSSLNITDDQAATIILAFVIAGLLYVLFHWTRLGVTMRAVVDDRTLAEMTGIRASRITMLSWSLGTALAGLAAILIAPGLTLSIPDLSLLVVSAYAAAIVGRLASTLWTFVGGIGLGILSTLLVSYLPSTNQVVIDLTPAMPFIVLFLVLLVLKRQRDALERIQLSGGEDVPRWRPSLVWAVACVVVVSAIGPGLTSFQALVLGTGLIYAVLLLSLVLVSGLAGEISLAQFSFLGLGSVLLGHLASYLIYPVALVLSVVITGAIGVAIALPAVRLRGLYLALATLAFAIFMDTLVFVNSHVISAYTGVLTVPAPAIFGLKLLTIKSQLPLLAVVLSLSALGIVWVRRSRFGRALTAMRDAPTSASALGLNVTVLKVAVFGLAAALAGLAGCLYGGIEGQVTSTDFVYLNSLSALLVLAIQGMSSIAGAVEGAAFFAIVFLLLPDWISSTNVVQALQPLLVGLGIMSLVNHPQGAIAMQVRGLNQLMRRGSGAAGTAGRGGPAGENRLDEKLSVYGKAG
jgi:branched-chain amino acid transport system permease protein